MTGTLTGAGSRRLDYAIETRALRKRYRNGVEALKGIDLQVKPGICFGLLGPNGAGKSTLVKMLLSIVRPTSGSASLNGVDITLPAARQGVGYLPEGHTFPRYLTGEGVCRYFGQLAGLRGPSLDQDIPKKLELVGMGEWARNKVTTYSKGMKQRVGLAQALLGSPSLIFLDEPTDGLDPVGRAEIRDVIRTICGEGVTVFLNSHLLQEVEQICDEVAILNKGELLEQGSVAEITRSVTSGGEGLTVKLRAGKLPDPLWTSLEERGATRTETWFRLEVPDEEAITGIIDELRAEKVAIYEVVPIKRSLEQTFVDLVSEPAEGIVEGGEG